MGNSDPAVWGPADRPLELVARNVTTRYVAILVDGVTGLLLLPFNVEHLGPSAYGLWALTTSITWFFNMLDLGYGGAAVKFVSQYRAWRDRSALNEILSTLWVVFTAIGVLCLALTGVLAWRVDTLFNIEPEQRSAARQLLLIVGGYLGVRFGFNIFGSVVYGFQRYYLNNAVSIGVSVAAASVNVAVLSAGSGLVTLVAATTAVRLLSVGLYAWNAYRVYPGLQISPRLFRRSRLKEVTGFSVYMLVLDWAAKLNHSADPLVIGALLNTTAVAVWTVAQRLTQFTQYLTNQLNDALFPNVVDSDAAKRQDRLQAILIQGTKLSLALAAPLCVGLIVLAEPLIYAWVGTDFSASIPLTQILLLVVLVRISTASANLILRGAGEHRLLAWTNASTAVVNVALSIILIGPFGLVGVAVATLIPITAAAGFILYPAACRRVGLSLVQPLASAIWPAIWPAFVMGALLQLGRSWSPDGIFEVALHLAVGALVYLALFGMFGNTAEERRFYWTKMRSLLARRRPTAPAVGEAARPTSSAGRF